MSPDPEPLNREPSPPTLISTFLSSSSTSYDRNHGSIPHLSASTHKVQIKGLVSKPLTLSISDLAETLPQHTVTCALQCAGNRRHNMRTAVKEVSGIDWYDGAVMNCTWTGPLLADVLARAGVTASYKSPVEDGQQPLGTKSLHVSFSSYAASTQKDSFYGGSVPLERALSPSSSVLLALSMNSSPLTPNHGFPVRVVVPGVAGARSVKWLDTISVQEEESECHYQRRDYKILPKEVQDMEQAKNDGWWERTPALMDMPINSVIATPKAGEKVERDKEGKVEVRGYALPAGEDGPVVRVEVRVDGDEGEGEWSDAELLEGGDGEEGKWAWCLWRWKGKVMEGKRSIWSRATDRGGNMQEEERSEWNLRGVAYNGYGKVELEVV